MRKMLCLMVLFQSVHLYSQKIGKEEWHTQKFIDHFYYLTEVMFHDVINPPAAARFYSYSAMAAYQIMSEHNKLPPLNLILKNYIDDSRPKENIDENFSAIYAMLETGKNIIPSGYSLEEKQKLLYKAYLKQGIKKNILDASVEYAEEVSKKIIEYSKTDGYLKLSALNRYQPIGADSTWFPTPPEYMGAVEPNWNTIRTFFLDSACQFKPKDPIYFNTKKTSPFYKSMEEVYTTTKNLSPEQILIAQFWDCNPFASFYVGHVSVGIKKISPGGHWMGITGLACQKAKFNLERTVQAYALVAMVLHDGFVSCWDSKYKTHRIRPKTAINKYIDPKWNPLLETPPFPEYTSGHSVVSTASAEVLTYLFGDNFSYTDNTEVFFGLPERKFNSFFQAADEAAISRLYGGIHFMDAIEEGKKQGTKVGKYALSKYFTGAN
ncbi:MAG TPA: vanadium-dependent haloperoxidase [Cytophagales bacterium]|nr:vanadium-dependent haloperoxidase [Cytophagales bacterium]